MPENEHEGPEHLLKLTNAARRLAAETGILCIPAARCKDLLSAGSRAFFIADEEGRVTDANTVYLSLTGHQSMQEIAGRRFLEWIAVHDRDKAVSALSSCLRDGALFGLRVDVVTPTGVVRPVTISALTIAAGARRAIMGLCTQRTEPPLTSAELRASDLIWSHAMDFVEDPIYLIDLQDRVIRANRPFYRLTGLDPSQIIGADIVKVIHPSGESEPCPVCAARRERRDVDIMMEKGHPHNPFGRPILAMVRIIRDEDGNPMAVLKAIRDLSAEAEMRRQAQIVKQVREAIITADMKGIISSWNRGAADMLAYHAEEVLGGHISRIFPAEDRSVLEQQLIAPLLQTGSHQAEVRLLTKEGAAVHAVLYLDLLRNNQGEPVGMVVSALDITERKAIESRLQASSNHLQALYDASPDMIFVHDKSGRIVDANRNMLQGYGYGSIAEVRSLLPSDLSAEGYTVEMALDRITQALDDKKPDFEWLAKRSDGSIFPVEVRLRRIDLHRPDGLAEPGILAVVRDITEQKQAEERAVRHAHRQRMLLDMSQAITVTTDLRKLYRTVIASAKDLLNLDFSTLMLLSGDKKQLVIKDTLGFPQTMIETFRLVEGEGLSTYVVKNAFPGTVVDFRLETRFSVPSVVTEKGILSAVCVPMMLEDSVFGVLIGHTLEQRVFSEEDVALYQNMANQAAVAIQRSQGLAALAESQQKYQRLIDSANDAIFVADAKTGLITDANKKAGELLGVPPGKIIGMHQSELHPPGEAERYRGIFQDHIARGSAVAVDALVQTREGETIPVEISASTTEVGGRTILQGIFRDTRERKKAEQQLLTLAALIENSSDFIGIADLRGNVFYLNRAGAQLVGLTPEQAVAGKHMWDYIAGDDRSAFEDIIAAAKERRTWKGELRFRHFGTSDSIPVEMNIFSVLDPVTGKPTAIATISRDISNRKKMEEELIKSQKLESLGVLAGGIAHDFNNLLTAIIGNVALAQMREQADDRKASYLSQAESAAHRARSLTHQLLTFSRGGAPVKRLVDLGPVLKEAAGFALRGARARCEFILSDDLWPVEADEGQISQAINNLVINANQAMPEGGVITIEGRNITVGGESDLPLPPGGYVRISVGDTGVGIAKEYIGKIFDPYFTTKHTGSGLGLASCYSIITKHGGHIAVASEPRAGTTFTLYLPALPGQKPESESMIDEMLAGKGRILIVDDDDAVRAVASELLRTLGYEVEAVTDGEKALARYRAAGSSGLPYELVITDLTIPGGMGGKELLVELKKRDPQVKAIVTSGYHEDPILAHYEDYGFSGAIMKPFRLEELSRTVARVLRLPRR